jgi:hypothetical protein
VPGVDGDCLVIEADTDEALSIAENSLFQRVAAISITPVKNMHGNGNGKGNNGSGSGKGGTAANVKRGNVKKVKDMASLLKIKTQLGAGQLVPEKRRHVFVDNSNLFIGAQTIGILIDCATSLLNFN